MDGADHICSPATTRMPFFNFLPNDSRKSSRHRSLILTPHNSLQMRSLEFK
jgi:hypothetical protein